MEDFVNLEIAKKLENKGFDKPCVNAINSFGCTYLNGWCEYLDNRDGEYILRNDLKKGDYLLPTIPQVLKWFRREKGIHVVIEINDSGSYCWSIQNIRNHAARISSHFNNYFKDYELTVLGAIKYVLDNLI